jgi:hypothetical protein
MHRERGSASRLAGPMGCNYGRRWPANGGVSVSLFTEHHLS